MSENSDTSRFKPRRRRVYRRKPTTSIPLPSVELTSSPISLSFTLPPVQIYPQFAPLPSPQPPLLEVRAPNAEDKIIADIVRLGVAVARRYPKETAAFAFGFGIAALIDATRNN
jgi:hypothetical protein